MLLLPNGCSCSTPSIFPKNWKANTANIKTTWYIQYYFYDPNFKEKYPNGHLKIIKGGVNYFKTLSEKRLAIKLLYDELLDSLKKQSYNPITKAFVNTAAVVYEIEPTTRLMPALYKSLQKLTLENSTIADIKSMLGWIDKVVNDLQLESLTLDIIKRKHIKTILEKMYAVNVRFSNNRYNKYRSYLLMLFKELVEIEAIETNPIIGISIKKVEKRDRVVLTDNERRVINDHLKRKTPLFWRFVHIFFHSGARVKELLAVQKKHVDLDNQSFKVLVRKGRSAKWHTRIIKDSALPLWKELLEIATTEDFIFSTGLVPGANMIRREQITRRWHTHVKQPSSKGGLNIKADFYSLKHLNIDETAALLDIQQAAKMAGHTSPVVTLNYYAVNEKERSLNRLKKLSNKFA